MALGVISGLGPLAGLWCGVLVGIAAAVFGGTRALVSGPSAVMAVITATLLMDNEVSLPELAVIIAMAGAIQIALGLAGVGRFVSYMPHIVLTGFMSGIGVLLLWAQAEKLFGYGPGDLAVAALCLSVLFLWPVRVGRVIPAPLAAVGVGWTVAQFVPGIHQLGPVPVGFPIPVVEIPSLEFLAEAVGPAMLIALISSVYTLMWSLIADTLTGSRHNPNRELCGLGLGNLAAGFFGVLPGSGNIATMTAHPLRRKDCCRRHHLPGDNRGPHPGPWPLCGTSALGGIFRNRHARGLADDCVPVPAEDPSDEPEIFIGHAFGHWP